MITRKTDDMNDSLEGLFTGDTGPVRIATTRPGAVEFKSAEERFEEKCTKCRGTGRFIGRNGRALGQCFACKGAGKLTFKTSPQTRATETAQRSDRRTRNEDESLEAFRVAQPQIYAWLMAEQLKFPFAADMVAGIRRFGDLTDRQLDTCQRLAEKAAAKVAEKIERIQTAPQVDTAGIDRLKVAFDKAIAYARTKGTGVQLRNPKITIGGMTISPAKATSKNPGALYVKSNGEYLGKIADGKFLSVSACTPAQRDQVLAFISDPAQAAKVYGQETGVCCICNATLKSKWRLRGIGPVCAEKMGWAGLAEDFGVQL